MPASTSTSLLTDMYKPMMLGAVLKDGTAHHHCILGLFGCRLPVTRRLGVVTGTGYIPEALERFEFNAEQIGWLHDQGIVSKGAAQLPASWRFTDGIWGYAEGECYFPGSPLLTVEDTFTNCTLLEMLLLSILNHDCAVISATPRMTIAVHGCSCIDVGACRVHERAVVPAARVAIIGGFQDTSGLEVAKRHGIRCIGAAAYVFTFPHDTERDAFDSQVAKLDTGTTLLADTYDIRQNVISIVKAARAASGELGVMCLGSDSLVVEAFKVRGWLDTMGTTTTKITVTSDLDEYTTAALGAVPADSYGVSTKFVTGSDIPMTALVYEAVQCEDSNGQIVPVAKKAESRPTVGGRKIAGRVMGESGYATKELPFVGMSSEEGQALLAERDACSLQIQLVRGGQIGTEVWGLEAPSYAQEHHLRARNELPYQA